MSGGAGGGALRLLAPPLALLLGATVAVSAVVLHRAVVDLGGFSVPWGAVLGVGGSVVVSLGVGSLTRAAWPVAAYGIGWCAAVVLLLAGRPEGDYLVAGDGRGWGFLVGGALAMVSVTLLGVLAAPTRVPTGADPQDGLVPHV